MRHLRLIPPLLIFGVVTVLFAAFLWYLAVAAEIFLFGGDTPECTNSDSCSWRGDIIYAGQDSWLAALAWLALSGLLLAWPFKWVMRANKPVRHEPHASQR